MDRRPPFTNPWHTYQPVVLLSRVCGLRPKTSDRKSEAMRRYCAPPPRKRRKHTQVALRRSTFTTRGRHRRQPRRRATEPRVSVRNFILKTGTSHAKPFLQQFLLLLLRSPERKEPKRTKFGPDSEPLQESVSRHKASLIHSSHHSLILA